MATTTGLALLQLLSERIGDHTPLTTTSDGNSIKSSWVDTGLRNLSGGDDPDFCENWYIKITDSDSAANGEVRRIRNYSPLGEDGDSPTGIVGQVFTGGQINSGVNYQLHRWDPVLKRESINRAIRQLYSILYLPIRDESIVIDDLLTNGDMENFTSGVPDSWTEVNSPTSAKETSRVFRGSASVKLTGPSSTVGQLTQAPDVNLPDLAGKTATLRGRVWTDGANQARLKLDWDGSDIETGTYHKGDSEFERLSVSGTIPTTATQVKAILEVAANAVAYFDHVYLLIDGIYKYTLPTTLVGWPSRVLMQRNEANVNGEFYQFPPQGHPIAGRILRIEGKGNLSEPDTDTAMVEIEKPYTDLVTAYAEGLFWRQLASPARSSTTQRQGFLDAAAVAFADAEGMVGRGIRMPRMSALKLESTAWFEEDADGKYIQFQQPRSTRGSSVI